VIEVVAPAKLTLTLRVVGVRDDGMHLIDAEMVTLDLADRLVIDPEGDGLEIEGGGEVPGGADNLVRRALRLVRRTAHIRLLKRIPAGAGLGGGSADAAAVLRWAGFADVARAAALGADVPFCLVGGRARVTGIGEMVAPLPYVDQTLTLLTPPLACSTPAVYRAWDELGAPHGHNGNDLEPAALVVAPELARYRDALWAAAGVRPRLAGSGSTWFVMGAYPGPGRAVVRTVPVPPARVS
jgi:4-diphosphocytidyl-2-C-methyl-D-erythritol kinase